MRLQQATLYAIWSVVELAAHPGEAVPAAELAARYGMSQHHLAKVLRSLSLAGIVTSARGPGGGCSFVGNVNRLTLQDIISLFEPDLAAPRAAAENGSTHEVGRMLGEIDRITAATLRSVTIRTILENARRRAAREKVG
jgi:Rrf2 family nitric oxide-sensitive transcriptional repressor